jgi:hypothetical protein
MAYCRAMQTDGKYWCTVSGRRDDHGDDHPRIAALLLIGGGHMAAKSRLSGEQISAEIALAIGKLDRPSSLSDSGLPRRG